MDQAPSLRVCKTRAYSWSAKVSPLDKKSPSSATPYSKKTKAQLIEELEALKRSAENRDVDGVTASADSLFRAAFESSTNMMAVTQISDGTHFDVNPAWLTAFGYSREEVIGRTSSELGVWQPYEQRDALLETLKQEGSAKNVRATMKAKDGNLIECLVSMSPLEAMGEDYLLFSALDNTAFNALLAERRQTARGHEIAAEQAKLSFWRWSFSEERLTDHSESHPLIHGYSHDVPDSYEDMLEYVHPDDRERVLKTYEETDSLKAGFDIEYRIITANGELRWLREYAEIEHDDHGDPIAQVGFSQDITTLKQAQESLRDSSRDLEKAIEERTRELRDEIERRQEITRNLRERDAQYAQAERIANIHNWVSDATFSETLSYSKNVEKMFGLSREEILRETSNFTEYVHPDDRKRLERNYEKQAKSPESYEIEYRFCKPDGEIINILEVGEPVYDEVGKVIMFRGTTQDITARVKRDEELRRSLIMAEQAEKIAGLGHWVWDEIEDRCTYCTDALPDMYGVSMEEFLSHKTRSFDQLSHIHADDRQMVLDAYSKCVNEQTDYDIEYRINRKDGTKKWVKEIGSCLEVIDGQIKTTIGTLRDITAEKSYQQALEESESRNRAIVETAADAIITIDENGIIGTFNRAAERMFGFERDEVIGKNVEYLMPEPYASNHDVYLKNYLRTGKAQIIGIGREVEGLREDGSTFPMLLAVSEINVAGKRVFTGILRDISDMKEAEMQAIAARDEAQRANAAKTEFLAHMSHEFRTPLNAIIGFSEAMTSQIFGELGNSKYLDYVKDIKHSGDLLLHIVNDILDISKIEAGEMVLAEDNFLPSDAIKDCVATMRGMSLEEGGAYIDLIDELPAGHMVADERIFKQIILNLLSNAVKFTPGDGKISVTTSISPENSFLIRISDTGCGIPKEDLEVVLEPFGQSRSSTHTTHKGTGLGLSLSKVLVELHDGTLVIESEIGAGTTVTLSFPEARFHASQ